MKYALPVLLGIILLALALYLYFRPTPPLPHTPQKSAVSDGKPQPQADGPVVRLTINKMLASAEATEAMVTAVLEESIASLDGIDSLHSGSRPTGATFTLHFKPDQAMDAVLPRVQSALTAAQARLPGDIDPLISRNSDPPVLWLALAGDTMPTSELSPLALQLQERLLTCMGVGDVQVIGSGRRVLSVKIQGDRLAAYSLDVGDVLEAVRATGKNLGGAAIDTLENTIVAVRNGTPIRLRDIAQIANSWENAGKARVNSKPTIALGINNAQGAVLDETVEAVRQRLPDLLRNLPPGVTLSTAVDHSKANAYRCFVVDFFSASLPAETDRTLRALEQRLTDNLHPGVQPSFLTLQPDQSTEMESSASIYIQLPRSPKDLSASSLIEHIEEIIQPVVETPGVASQVLELSGQGALARIYPVHLRLEGPQWDELQRFAERFAKRLRAGGVIKAVKVYPAPAVSEVTVEVDRNRASELGITPKHVDEAIEIATKGLTVARISNRYEPYSVVVGLDNQHEKDAELPSLMIRGTGDKLVPLSTLVALKRVAVLPSVKRFNRRRVIELTATLASGKTPAEADAQWRKIEAEVRQELGLSAQYSAVPLPENSRVKNDNSQTANRH